MNADALSRNPVMRCDHPDPGEGVDRQILIFSDLSSAAAPDPLEHALYSEYPIERVFLSMIHPDSQDDEMTDVRGEGSEESVLDRPLGNEGAGSLEARECVR